VYVLYDVKIFNRTDGGNGVRINPFRVELYDGANVVWSMTNQTFVEDITGPNIAGMSFAVPNVAADRVRVALEGVNYLSLAEVEAYTIVPEPATLLALAGSLAFLRLRRRAR
jgi:hypothetical protein